jgi:glutaredoxin-like protein
LEIASLSDKIKVETYDLVADKDKADEYRLDKIPAIAIVGARDYGVRYFGMPSGFEFNSFVQDIVDVSRGTTDLSPATKEKLKSLKNYIHIQVFTTPTCPYCPSVVRMAHKMAIESDRILADMVDAMEFMHLVERYHVHGTPRVVINDSTSFEGVVPEAGFLAFVLKAAGEISEEEFARDLAKFHHH